MHFLEVILQNDWLISLLFRIPSPFLSSVPHLSKKCAFNDLPAVFQQGIRSTGIIRGSQGLCKEKLGPRESSLLDQLANRALGIRDWNVSLLQLETANRKSSMGQLASRTFCYALFTFSSKYKTKISG